MQQLLMAPSVEAFGEREADGRLSSGSASGMNSNRNPESPHRRSSSAMGSPTILISNPVFQASLLGRGSSTSRTFDFAVSSSRTSRDHSVADSKDFSDIGGFFDVSPRTSPPASILADDQQSFILNGAETTRQLEVCERRLAQICEQMHASGILTTGEKEISASPPMVLSSPHASSPLLSFGRCPKKISVGDGFDLEDYDEALFQRPSRMAPSAPESWNRPGSATDSPCMAKMESSSDSRPSGVFEKMLGPGVVGASAGSRAPLSGSGVSMSPRSRSPAGDAEWRERMAVVRSKSQQGRKSWHGSPRRGSSGGSDPMVNIRPSMSPSSSFELVTSLVTRTSSKNQHELLSKATRGAAISKEINLNQDRVEPRRGSSTQAPEMREELPLRLPLPTLRSVGFSQSESSVANAKHGTFEAGSGQHRSLPPIMLAQDVQRDGCNSPPRCTSAWRRGSEEEAQSMHSSPALGNARRGLTSSNSLRNKLVTDLSFIESMQHSATSTQSPRLPVQEEKVVLRILYDVASQATTKREIREITYLRESLELFHEHTALVGHYLLRMVILLNEKIQLLVDLRDLHESSPEMRIKSLGGLLLTGMEAEGRAWTSTGRNASEGKMVVSGSSSKRSMNKVVLMSSFASSSNSRSVSPNRRICPSSPSREHEVLIGAYSGNVDRVESGGEGAAGFTGLPLPGKAGTLASRRSRSGPPSFQQLDLSSSGPLDKVSSAPNEIKVGMFNKVSSDLNKCFSPDEQPPDEQPSQVVEQRSVSSETQGSRNVRTDAQYCDEPLTVIDASEKSVRPASILSNFQSKSEDSIYSTSRQVAGASQMSSDLAEDDSMEVLLPRVAAAPKISRTSSVDIVTTVNWKLVQPLKASSELRASSLDAWVNGVKRSSLGLAFAQQSIGQWSMYEKTMLSDIVGGISKKKTWARSSLEKMKSQGDLHVEKTSSPVTGAVELGIHDFETVKPISKGAFGVVYLCKHKPTGEHFAVKVLKKADVRSKNQFKYVNSEKSIMAAVDCPFVVKLICSFQTRENLYLVMEYVQVRKPSPHEKPAFSSFSFY